MEIKNDFLLKIGIEARKSRVSFWSDTDTVSIRITQGDNQKDAGLWFRTAGCSYDACGGCIMCDYSNGPRTTPKQMISYVAQGLKQIPHDCGCLLVSPSGSMLDSDEVPRMALVGILNLLSKTAFPQIVFETRAETVTEEVIKLCKDILGERFYGLYLGLESALPFVLKHCINKQLHLSAATDAINICKENDVNTMFNVLVGAPFLSVNEIIQSTVQTVRWVLDKGATRCDLFPVHVKRHTPLAALYEEGLYSSPSLWALVEVLNGLGEDTWRQVGLSWYTPNGAYNIISSPSTCPNCIDTVLGALSAFAQTHEPKFIHKLNAINCACKGNYKKDTEFDSLPERVLCGYAALANRFLGADWWNNHVGEMKSLVREDWNNGGELHAL